MTRVERRKALRAYGFELATITLDDGWMIDCFLTNWSAHGACVILTRTEHIADGFTLESARTGRRAQVLVRWRDFAELGISFAD